jgi:hypothetical protein
MTVCLWYSCLAYHVHTASLTLICDDSLTLTSVLQSLAAHGCVKGSGSYENYEYVGPWNEWGFQPHNE